MVLPTATKQTFQLICQKIQIETPDVKTFIFSYPKSATKLSFHYYAGQHLTFTVKMAGKAQSCCYTLSSSPTTPDYVSITIKRIPQGKISNYFHDHFKIGQVISTQEVAGNFYLSESVPQKVLLLSAGSGVTPMLSMLRYMVTKQCKNQIVFLHSAQKENDLIAQAEITSLARQHGNCQIIYTLTQSSCPQWYGFQGRLNEHMLHNIEQISHYQTYVCGPKSFRKTAQQLLRKLGLPPNHYHYESYGEYEYSKQDVSSANKGNTMTNPMIDNKIITTGYNKAKVSISFKRWNKQYLGNKEDSLLEQGEAAGLILPYSCRGGCCGSCKAKLISGQVKQHSTNGLSASERQQGYILLCSCNALTDVVISHE
ncbi:MAG: 2Fe-2S iron-sulfur cluster binding domain-containing protein [Colwellia sp.]|uniref:hybrid-cluster NAD(P)-dependent oxidoreductase n=1 Tax=Colwellia sp. TaxID=56799 RepID=UPI0025BE4866|nr:hybrid-cluster NAD(P)-dependent oxidoreductase [Colwellia sp.]NQZ28341.1 2Fe-2S iron-sulfur cluster binding domain-containing protein [Colwellia sp.]